MSKSRGTQRIAGHEEVAQRLRRLAETRDQIPPRALAAELYEEISYALLHGVRWDEIAREIGASSMRGLQNAYYRVRKARQAHLTPPRAHRGQAAASSPAPAPPPPRKPEPKPDSSSRPQQKKLKLPETPKYDFSKGAVVTTPGADKNLNI